MLSKTAETNTMIMTKLLFYLPWSINGRTQCCTSILAVGPKTNNFKRYHKKMKQSLLKALHFKGYSESIAGI